MSSGRCEKKQRPSGLDDQSSGVSCGKEVATAKNHLPRVVLKAEDIAHVLRDGVAILPGSRDRTGRAVIFFPPKDQQHNPDNIRNVLRYLHTVTSDETRDHGFTVIIDMRGKHAYNNVRPILKAINHLCETTSGLNMMVLIIKPDTFWEKQKANMLIGSWSFEVHMISIDAVMKFVDPSQLVRELGGSYPYDHDDWLDTRLELERWIWQISDVMRHLECQRRSMADSQSPVDISTAEAALSQHSSIKKAIIAIPVDRLQNESDRISERINRAQCGISNPDLVSSIPHMVNLLISLRNLKSDVFKQWEARRVELEGCYQMKLFEHDAENMIDWTRKHNDTLTQCIGNIGASEVEACEKLREFDEFSVAADNAEVNIAQVTNIAIRLHSAGGQTARNKLERLKLRLDEEWSRFKEQLVKRKLILNAAVAFFSATKVYFAKLPLWVESPGVDPSSMSGKTSDVLEEAIQQHEKFWATVEEIYAEAFAQGSQLIQLLKSVEVDDPTIKELLGKLTRAHKHLLCLWKERRVRLHSMLALIAFRTDTQLVVEWLEQHGDPYLTKNTSIGESIEQARILQRNHSHFRQIARNTYSNANKLFEASKAILESGVCDAEKMRAMIGDLDQRVQQFTHRVEVRFNLLNQSVLFHTHYREIMAWYDEMEKKYGEQVIDTEVDACERSKEQWLYETDGTAQAYATTIGEGNQLVHDLEVHSQHTGIDYTSNISCINRLIRNIEGRNSKLSNMWNPQRVLLQIGLRFAVFVRDNCEVLSQIRSWEEDMRGMLESSTFAGNAEKVLPFHQDNTSQVKMAVKNIRKCAQEVLQSIHGNGFSDLRTRQGKNVTDLIRENLKILESAEHQVMKYAAETSYRIEGSRKLGRIRNVVREIVAVFDREERALQAMSTVPVDLEQALRAQEEHELFIKKIELNNMDSVRVFYELSNELIREGSTDRAAVVELNEMVTGRWRRLSGLAEERNKLLKAAIVCYKTYLTGVYPILDQLEKDYSQNPDRDWCVARVGETPQERVNVISELLSKHMDYKDRFLRGCIYAQKTSEMFLKYIERTSTGSGTHNRFDSERIIRMKSDLRERQSKILELWTKKKKQLDRCQQFVLLDATRHVLIDWLCGEGERRLAEFLKMGLADVATLEDFHTFKLTVKEERAKIQTFLCMAGQIKDEAMQHASDIADCVADVRVRFEKFSKRVAECETILRGGKAKDDLSLNRLSDSNVEESMNIMKDEQNSKMREPMHELIKTEKDYIEDLRKCIQVYISEFDTAEANSTLPPVLRDRRHAIFGNYEKLYAFHSEKFVHELSKYEDDPEEVGCSFTVWVDYLNELYTDYCVNMEQNNHVVALPEVMAFFEAIRERHGLEQNNSLHSMRIKPVQRCTRYKLLMEQLLKHCSNVEEIREAYEVVKSLPRRVNDIIHFNGLEKDKLGVVGPFVMQDLLTVWEPRNYFNKTKGKERQVFLFEQAIVIAKKMDFTTKNVKYIVKGKPIPIGTVASNENRIDLRSAPQPKEEVKIMWVKRIRELTQALLPLNLGVGLENVSSSGNSSTAETISTKSSNASTNSIEFPSRDADETSSLDSQRLSIQSTDSNQRLPFWYVNSILPL
ncbi:RhoGEF domain protein [Dictyocaulus viviparus]|uniref:RhoGEF domain protein n=1 Tax=Dictyocaulus viviparus TaxID=29172 RepID=A0A0D8Y4F8_DICVI|nr:RhoGEF domain protein [Dictyocaulus viviparus]